MINIPNYQILNQIYESVNSLVYRGLRNKDNQPIILKVLKEDFPTLTKLVHYQQEYEITRRFNHEGIIKVYRLEKYENTLVIIFEDFGGESLRQLMAASAEKEAMVPLFKEGLSGLLQFLALAISITEIVEKIHAANIIHKDINPSNILWNQTTEQIKIIDFGISTELPRENPVLKNPNQLEGTLPYLSPEQTGRMNRAMDYRTDFYALGVTFYELLTHHLPFETDDAMELVHCHLAKQPISPHQLNPEIPPAISDIIMKLLEKMAEDRYQSAWGLKADLEECKTRFAQAQLEPFTLAQQDVSEKFHLPQRLYGRESEIETLLTTFDRASGGVSEIMLVAGYSGIGKSALVQEIYKPITEKRGHFIAGKFNQFQRNIPYSAIVCAFRDLVRQLLTESETQLTEWKEKILAALGPNGQIIIEVIPEMSMIIGAQPSVPKLGATAAQNRFNLVFQNFIQVFCQPKHPLVIFLDDLQWADSASLQLMTLIMAQSQSLFFIGAYRNNEVDAAHPLMLTLTDRKKEGLKINTLTLAPLALPYINQFIAETLNNTLEKTRSLAELIQKKTNGNPFFMGEFMKTLYTEKLLNCDSQQGGWQWDLSQIRARNITDNVIDLMTDKIQQLGDKTQQVLKIAACIGNRFELETLAIVSEKNTRETKADLWEALAKGLLLPLGNAYKFVHDRIQQAVYSLIPDEQKQVVHWQVGSLLLKNTPPERQEKNIFAIVDQLNAGIEQISQQSERKEVAQLNLIAGKKAKASAAYQPAFNYLMVGIGLLNHKFWQSQYDLILALHVEAAEAAYLSGNVKPMEQLIEVALLQAKTLLDTVKVYEIKIQSYMAQNKMLEAVEIGRHVLKLLDVSLPKNPNTLHIIFGLLRTKIALGRKRIDSLIDLPEMTHLDKLAAMRILASINSAAYIGVPKLFPLLVFKQVNLSIKYGNTVASAYAYAAYGMILSGAIGDIETGYQFGNLALMLLEKLNAKEFQSRTIYVVSYIIKPWREALRNTLKPLLVAYQRGIETGDLEFAAYAIMSYSIGSTVAGQDLANIEQELLEYREIINQLKQESGRQLHEIGGQVILNLRKQIQEPWHLNGEICDERKVLPLYLEANNINALCYFYCNKLTLCYLFQEYSQAVENATLAEKYLGGAMGLIIIPLFYFYDSLTRLTMFADAQKSEKKRILKKVVANQKKMKKWAHHAPMNHLHKFYLVEAERTRVLGKNKEAREYYDQAIDLAHDNGYLNEEALANELTGKFYLVREQNGLANHYLRNAHDAYSQWGAVAKVKDLETRYPQLKKAVSAPHQPVTVMPTFHSGTHTSSTLDLASVLKASQTIASEIELKCLLEKLITILIENAGAQRGVLILENNGQWVIQAEGTTDKAEISVLQSIPVNLSDNTCQLFVPATVINYVARAKESVVLHNAIKEGQFTRDQYIVKHQIKSALCAPLLNQGNVIGLLYLENNLMTDAFTQDRLEVLNLLSSQTAISIEKSLLYNNLEQKVAERTQELSDALEHLKATQSQLVESEKMASLGGLVAGVAHEINTPIGIGVTAASTLADRTTQAVTAYKNKQLKGSALITYFDLAVSTSQLVLKNLKRAAKLVQSFKQVAVDQTNLEKRSFAVKQYIQATLTNLHTHLKETQHQITINGDEQIEINSYPGAFSQIITHLVMNSLLHAYKKGDKGELCFELYRDSERLILEYSDDGCGIPPENLGKIFEPFFTTIRARGGIGLGLHIVYNVVTQKMQGTILAKSEIGVGTTFIIDLPVQ